MTRSSGSPVLDRAARRIVLLGAPYGRFSDELRARVRHLRDLQHVPIHQRRRAGNALRKKRALNERITGSLAPRACSSSSARPPRRRGVNTTPSRADARRGVARRLRRRVGRRPALRGAARRRRRPRPADALTQSRANAKAAFDRRDSRARAAALKGETPAPTTADRRRAAARRRDRHRQGRRPGPVGRGGAAAGAEPEQRRNGCRPNGKTISTLRARTARATTASRSASVRRVAPRCARCPTRRASRIRSVADRGRMTLLRRRRRALRRRRPPGRAQPVAADPCGVRAAVRRGRSTTAASLAPLDGFAVDGRAFFAERRTRAQRDGAVQARRVRAVRRRVAERARRAGAVNCLRVDRRRRLVGDNTDGVGLVRDLAAACWRRGDARCTAPRVLLLGAGRRRARRRSRRCSHAGARALVVANRERRARRGARAEVAGAATTASIDGPGLAKRSTTAFDLVVNATSASLAGRAAAGAAVGARSTPGSSTT